MIQAQNSTADITLDWTEKSCHSPSSTPHILAILAILAGLIAWYFFVEEKVKKDKAK